MTAWIEAFGLMLASIGASISLIVICKCLKALILREWIR